MATKNTDSTSLKLARFGSLGAALILALLPFHTLFTTWLGSNLGHLDAFRIWKELIVLILGTVAVIILVRGSRFFEFVKSDALLLLILAYTVLQVIMAVIAGTTHRVTGSALIYGLLANLRFFGFFAAVLVFANYSSWLRTHWPKLVFIPALLVITFGLLQLVLPNNFLTHFGYGPSTILPFQLVDQKATYIRLQSTLRGPNPLGAYLVLILSLGVVGYARLKKSRLNLGLLVAAGAVVLFFSYSRSAILGLAVSLFIILLGLIRSPKLRLYFFGLAAIAVIVGAGVVYSARNDNIVQNTVFHTDETSKSSQSSNEARSQSLEDGVRDIRNDPWGRGPGTAGPASVRNDHQPRIAEDYYLQIGQEVGVIGIVLFLAINVVVAIRLYRRRGSVLALGLLASLAGLTVVNLVSHAWADDTLALLWWGLAAISLATPVILKQKHHVQTTKKTEA